MVRQKKVACCGTCVYFLDAAIEGPKGICRRFPPAERRPSVVKKTDWCGEYVADN